MSSMNNYSTVYMTKHLNSHTLSTSQKNSTGHLTCHTKFNGEPSNLQQTDSLKQNGRQYPNLYMNGCHYKVATRSRVNPLNNSAHHAKQHWKPQSTSLSVHTPAKSHVGPHSSMIKYKTITRPQLPQPIQDTLFARYG